MNIENDVMIYLVKFIEEEFGYEGGFGHGRES